MGMYGMRRGRKGKKRSWGISAGDLDYERVHSRLREILSKAKKTLISRYLDQGKFSDTHACELLLAPVADNILR